MLDVNINDFIDFHALFSALYRQNEDTMAEVVDDVDDKTYREIINFKHSLFNHVEIDKSECGLDDLSITFVFSESNNDGNESNPEGSGFIYTIIYDICMDDFDSFASEGF